MAWLLLMGSAKGDQMATLSDEQIVGRLASIDRGEANAAVDEIVRRESLPIGLLLEQRGNRQIFAGTTLINPQTSILLPIPVPGLPFPESARNRIVTVEAAALYLICAKQQGNLHFAGAPLLIELAENPDDRVVGNAPERISRAFDAAERWYQSNRGAHPYSSDPIAGSGLAWY